MSQLFDFWKLAARLKDEPRRGWLQRLRLQHVESVADHSFGVAMITMFEAERRGYDVEKALKFALIHDLEEAFTGDLTPRDKKKLATNSVRRWKTSAINRILGGMPTDMRRRYGELWEELWRGNSKESKLVKQLDKLEMAFQASLYWKRGVKRQKLSHFYRSARRGVNDDELKRALKEIV